MSVTERIWKLEHELVDPPYDHGDDCLDCLRAAGWGVVECEDGSILFSVPRPL